MNNKVLKKLLVKTKRLNVLVIDDNIICLDPFVELLQNLFFDVYYATDIKLGLSINKEKKPDFVILDLDMLNYHNFKGADLDLFGSIIYITAINKHSKLCSVTNKPLKIDDFLEILENKLVT